MKGEGRKETWDFEGSFHDPMSAISSSRGSPLGPAGAKAGVAAGSSPSRLTAQLYWRFLWAGITRRSQTGAVVPSQRFLIDRMIAAVPTEYRGEIVELGAGTGVLTFRLAERCPQARILGCEINPQLAGDLKERVAAAGLSRRVRICSDPAEQLLARLARQRSKAPDFILSGIPLGNLVKHRAVALIHAIYDALCEGGVYVQFQYSLMDRKKIRNKFSELRTDLVLMNIPPAFVYYARR